jgi:predicted nucleotidyltransferase component of viral defense system
MKFEYTKADIEAVAREHNYTINNVEKILRLSFILNDLNTLPDFKGKLLLKGGTAINLVAFDKLPRLSVDLDLNFATNLPKDGILIV